MLLADEALPNGLHALSLGEERGRGYVAGDGLRVVEVEDVVAAGATDGEGHGEGLPPTARAPDALLVVEALRRHVRLEHGLQRPDVDAHLHCGGHRQQVDSCAAAVGLARVQKGITEDVKVIAFVVAFILGSWRLEFRGLGQEDPLEGLLAPGWFLCLAGEFLAVQPEGAGLTGAFGLSASDASREEGTLKQLTDKASVGAGASAERSSPDAERQAKIAASWEKVHQEGGKKWEAYNAAVQDRQMHTLPGEPD